MDEVRTLRRATRERGRLIRLRVSVVAGPSPRATCEPPDQHGAIVVGTSADTNLVLADPTVSRYHLELSRAEGGILVVDLGSLNGSFVGDLRIERAVVPPGTQVRVGDSTLVIEDGAAAERGKPGPAPEVPGIVGVSDAIKQVLRSIDTLAASTASVLVQGETGSGKERVARAIHERSPRRDKPLVVVDCGSMAPTLVASELFGHERGAFTGADRRHLGAFEQADGGTVFLDEIGELPLAVQPALLGVLERRRFRRVGGDREIQVDVRVVSATHRDLRAEVNRSSFRADLYFRLAVARIVIPPLRDRLEDIEPLVAHFMDELTGGAEPAGFFGPATMDALRAHPWSGNVRELRNVVESAIAMGQVSLESETPAPAPVPEAAATDGPRTYREARAAVLARFELDYLQRLMAECDGNASEAARRSHMDRPYLLSLLRRHRLR